MPDFGLSPTVVPVPIPNATNATDLGRKRSVRNVGGTLDGTYMQQVCLYVPSALQANLIIGQPYYMGFGSTIGQYYTAVAPAGSATSGITRLPVVLVESVLVRGTIPVTGGYAWFAFAGHCQALVDGTTSVAVDDTLRLNSAVVSGAFIKDPTAYTSQTSKTGVAKSLGVQAAASAVLTDILLFGEPGIIA